jgi:hypothetical protein
MEGQLQRTCRSVGSSHSFRIGVPRFQGYHHPLPRRRQPSPAFSLAALVDLVPRERSHWIIASAFHSDWTAVTIAIIGLGLTFTARAMTFWLADKVDRYNFERRMKIIDA